LRANCKKIKIRPPRFLFSEIKTQSLSMNNLLPYIFLFCLISSCKESKTLIHISGIPLQVEIADSPEERKRGLSGRKKIDGGMLFVFEEEDIYAFWMKDTYIPLSIAFIDRDGLIVSIQDMAPLYKNRVYIPPKPILYALEVEMRWFAKNGLKVGDTVIVPR